MGFVGTTTLKTVLENQSDDELREQLGALKGWIRVRADSGTPYWFVDHTDPEEEAEVSRLRSRLSRRGRSGPGGFPESPSGPAFKQLSDRKTILSELAQMTRSTSRL